MLINETAMLSKLGVTLPNDAIRRIGIAKSSRCWGAWLRHRVTPDGLHTPGKMPAHLLITPLNPNTWPCLLHLSIALRDEVGTVHRTCELISNNFTILSHTFSSTGHNHGTLDLVATAPDLLASSILTKWKRDLDFDDNYSKALLQDWAQLVLGRTIELKEQLISANRASRAEGGQFIRQRFVPPVYNKDRCLPCGLVYDPRDLPASVKAMGEQQFPDGVAVTWLQHPARYWFACSELRPFVLETNDRRTWLGPIGESASREYIAGLPFELDTLPLRTLASIDPYSLFARVMPIPAIECPAFEVVVSHTYTSKPKHADPTWSGEPRSKGLLRELTAKIKDIGGNICSMWNKIYCLSDELDRSDISFVVSDAEFIKRRSNFDVMLRNEISKVSNPFPGVEAKLLLINRFDCLRVFISKKNDWIQNSKGLGPLLFRTLEQELTKRGYGISVYPSTEGEVTNNMQTEIVSRIHKCKGVVLVVPAEQLASVQGMQWLHFELGVAMGAGLPYQILLEDDGEGQSVRKFNDSFRITEGHRYYLFSSTNVDQRVVEAVYHLDKQVRNSKDQRLPH